MTRTITEVKYVEKHIDSSLLNCDPEPLAPLNITDKNVARWIIDLRDSGDDCRGKLNSIKKLIE